MKYQLLISVMLALLATSGVQAQEQWTLERCINTALENSLNIESAKYDIERASINVTRAEHNRYPDLSANTGVNLGFGRSINPITNLFETQSILGNSIGLNTGVTVFNGFRIANSLKQANVNLDATVYDSEQIKRNIILNVANSYLNVLFAEENLKISQSQLAVSEGQLEQVRKLIDAGARPVNEAFDIEAQVATNEQLVTDNLNTKIIALLGLKQLMMLPQNTDISVMAPDNIEVFADPDVLQFEEVYNLAYQNEPSMQAAVMRMKAAAIGIEIAKGGLYPTLGVGANIGTNYARISGGFPNAGYGSQIDQNLNYGVGAQLSIPIYSNYSNRLNIQDAKVQALQVQNSAELTENTLMVTVQQALADAKAAKRRLQAAEKTLIARQASYTNAEKRYTVGAINSFELLTNQNNLQQAQVTSAVAKYEYLFATKVLDFYMGKPITL